MAVEGKTILQTPERTELTGKEGIPFQEGERNGHVLLERIREYSQTEVVDDLTSDDSEKALSAAQGKVLNDKIAEISNPASADKDGLMSKEDMKTFDSIRFSEDENSIWFNGKKYGVYILKGFENLSTDSNTGVIQSFLGDFTYDRWVDAVNTGNIVFVETNNILIPASVYANNSEDLNIMFVTLTYTYFVSIHYSTGSGYSINLIQQDSLVRVADVNNTLTNSSTDKPLSAAMGKELNDKVEAIKSEISALRDEIEALKGSGS